LINHTLATPRAAPSGATWPPVSCPYSDATAPAVEWQTDVNPYGGPSSARKVFAAIEAAIGDGSSASVSYTSFGLDHHITLKEVAPALRLLDHFGLIEVEPGPRLVNVFRFSDRWRTVAKISASDPPSTWWPGER